MYTGYRNSQLSAISGKIKTVNKSLTADEVFEILSSISHDLAMFRENELNDADHNDPVVMVMAYEYHKVTCEMYEKLFEMAEEATKTETSN